MKEATQAYLSRLEDCLPVDFEDGFKVGYDSAQKKFEKEIDKISLSNTDINSWGDGFEYAIQLVYKALNK